MKKVAVMKDHKRTVNRVAWHPTHGHTLLSGSQDGTMRYWDVRDPTSQVIVFDARSDAVRDVQFSPFYPNYFAAAFDNGAVQVWDIRRAASAERSITAHRGPCLALEWHPLNRDVIASGGRDLALRVWDLNETSRAISVVNAPTSVARLKWRPSSSVQRAHIAVGAAVMDPVAQIWNLESPRIPHRTILGHTDVVTGLLWHRAVDTFLWTCSKDGWLRCHDVRKAFRPIEHINTIGISWSVAGHQLAVVSDRVDRRHPVLRFGKPESIVYGADGSIDWKRMPIDSGMAPWTSATTNAPIPPDNAAEAVVLLPQENPLYGAPRLASQGLVHVLSPSGHARYTSAGSTLSTDLFAYLAEHYRFNGQQRPRVDSTLSRNATIAELCAYNASVAAVAGQLPLAKFWRVVATLIESELLVQQLSSAGSRMRRAESRSALALDAGSSANASDAEAADAAAGAAEQAGAAGAALAGGAALAAHGGAATDSDGDGDSSTSSDDELLEALDSIATAGVLDVARGRTDALLLTDSAVRRRSFSRIDIKDLGSAGGSGIVDREVDPDEIDGAPSALDDDVVDDTDDAGVDANDADDDGGHDMDAPDDDEMIDSDDDDDDADVPSDTSSESDSHRSNQRGGRGRHAVPMPRGKPQKNRRSKKHSKARSKRQQQQHHQQQQQQQQQQQRKAKAGGKALQLDDLGDVVRNHDTGNDEFFDESLDVPFLFASGNRALGAAGDPVDRVATGAVARWSRNYTSGSSNSAVLWLADDIDVGVPLDNDGDGGDPAQRDASSRSGSKAGGGESDVPAASKSPSLTASDAVVTAPKISKQLSKWAAAPLATVPLRVAKPPSLGGAATLMRALEWHVDQGDIQTAAFVVLVVQRVELLGISEEMRTRWLTSYLELLQRMRLWSLAIELVTMCGVEAIGNINAEKTQMPTGCPQCNRGLYEGAHRCNKCLITTSTCCLCHRVVRGLYVWCQGCGHGGHADHMDEWFRVNKNPRCPSGCGHVCDIIPGNSGNSGGGAGGGGHQQQLLRKQASHHHKR
jgi:WD40 repeat protein